MHVYAFLAQNYTRCVKIHHCWVPYRPVREWRLAIDETTKSPSFDLFNTCNEDKSIILCFHKNNFVSANKPYFSFEWQMPPLLDKSLYNTCILVPNSDAVLIPSSGKPLSLPWSIDLCSLKLISTRSINTSRRGSRRTTHISHKLSSTTSQRGPWW